MSETRFILLESKDDVVKKICESRFLCIKIDAQILNLNLKAEHKNSPFCLLYTLVEA